MKNESDYPLKTAGYNMVTDVPVFSADDTIEEIKDVLVDKSSKFNSLDYIYLTDDINTLVGVISIKDLRVTMNKTNLASQTMVLDLITANLGTDQEKLVYRALPHGLKSIPEYNILK